eukprot:5118801-Prymnesium_polylepis.1
MANTVNMAKTGRAAAYGGHDRVADGADHDGADEGGDARLVDADRVGDRVVVGSDDVVRCVRCGIALR